MARKKKSSATAKQSSASKGKAAQDAAETKDKNTTPAPATSKHVNSPSTEMRSLAQSAPPGTAHVVSVGDLRFPLVDTKKHTRRTFFVPRDDIIETVIRPKADTLFASFTEVWKHQQYRIMEWWTESDDPDEFETLVCRVVDLAFQAVYPFLGGDRDLFTGVLPELDLEYLVRGREHGMPPGVIPLCRAASAGNFDAKFASSVPPDPSFQRFAKFVANAQLGFANQEDELRAASPILPDGEEGEVPLSRDFLFQLRRVGMYVALSALVKESAVLAVVGPLSDEWVSKFEELRAENLLTLGEWKTSSDYNAFEEWRGFLEYNHLADLSCQAADEVFSVISRTPQGISFSSVAEVVQFCPQIGLDIDDDKERLTGATNIALLLKAIDGDDGPEDGDNDGDDDEPIVTEPAASELYDSFEELFDHAADVYHDESLRELLPRIRQQLLSLYALTFINLTYDAVQSHNSVKKGGPGPCTIM